MNHKDPTELRGGDWSSGSSGRVEQSIGVELATQKNRKIALWKVFGVLVSVGKHYTTYMKNPCHLEVGLSGKEQLQSRTQAPSLICALRLPSAPP